MAGYRYELKYMVSEAEAELLAIRLRLTMDIDPHAVKNNGTYFIRSLYFDDPWDSAVEDKVAGVEFRDKFRIRIYNLSPKAIKLERKHKNGQFIKKDSLKLSKDECDAMAAGNYAFMLKRKEPIAREFYGEFVTRGLKPKVLVDYDREPFIYNVQNVRVTIDRDIRTGMRCTDLFSAQAPTYPATEFFGQCIVEVKFNEYLPGYIRSLLQMNNSVHMAASKYLYCRQYNV
jgi:hypothetical protein